MAKIKINSLRKYICTTCKGNGYLKVGTEWGETVHQCWDCDSEGELYETSNDLIGDNNNGGVFNKLH
tara:strand:- start:106 stop:306 length:201 start_codon:yes stop_codon:yes gene_type:complete